MSKNFLDFRVKETFTFRGNNLIVLNTAEVTLAGSSLGADFKTVHETEEPLSSIYGPASQAPLHSGHTIPKPLYSKKSMHLPIC